MWDCKTHFILSREARDALNQPLPSTKNLKAVPRNRARIARILMSQKGAHPHIYWGPVLPPLTTNWWQDKEPRFPREAIAIQLLRAALFCHEQKVLIGQRFLLESCRLVPNVDMPLLQVCDWSQARFFTSVLTSPEQWASERRSVLVGCSALFFPQTNQPELLSFLEEIDKRTRLLTVPEKARLMTIMGTNLRHHHLSSEQTVWVWALERCCTGPMARRQTLEGLMEEGFCQDILGRLKRRFPWNKPKKTVRFRDESSSLQVENKTWGQVLCDDKSIPVTEMENVAKLLAVASLCPAVHRSPKDARATLWAASLMSKSSISIQSKGIRSENMERILVGISSSSRPSSHELACLALKQKMASEMDTECVERVTDAIHVCFVAAVLFRGYVGAQALLLAALWMGGAEQLGSQRMPLSKKQWWWKRLQELAEKFS